MSALVCRGSGRATLRRRGRARDFVRRKCELILMLSLTCKRAAALLSASMERAPGLCERLLLRLHLRVCSACARYKAQLQLLREALARRARRIGERPDGAAPALTADARARFKRSLRDADRDRACRG